MLTRRATLLPASVGRTRDVYKRQGRAGKAVIFDAKLAAYLLNPAASGYDVQHLAAQYGVRPAFSLSLIHI